MIGMSESAAEASDVREVSATPAPVSLTKAEKQYPLHPAGLESTARFCEPLVARKI